MLAEFKMFGLKKHECHYLRQALLVMFLQINLSYDCMYLGGKKLIYCAFDPPVFFSSINKKLALICLMLAEVYEL